MDNTTLLGIKAGIAAVAGTLTAVWGWFGWLVVAWVGLMLSILVVCIALVADWLIGTIIANIPGITLPFTYSVLLAPLVIVWYIIGELGSLAEHAVTFGAPVPSWLVNILDISKNAVDTAGEKITGREETSESAGDGSGDTTTKD